MPNAIALAKNYTDLLDEVYRGASVTADLTSDSALIRQGANVNELIYPQIEVTGLGDYDRNSGYTDGSVTLAWKTATFNYDCGTKIAVDAMDDQESFNLAFGAVGATLQREKVAPEADAFTFSTLAGVDGISKLSPTTFSGAAEFLEALLEAKNTMDEDEVPEEGRILYATPTLLNSVMSLDTTKSREVLNAFSVRKKVPQSRFYTAIDLLDGKTAGEELGHYRKCAKRYEKCASTDTGALKVVADSATPASGEIKVSSVTPLKDPAYTPAAGDYVREVAGKDINFMIIHRPAVLKWDKHTASDVIPPSANPSSDAYISKYRKYGIVDVYKNKVAGIYLSAKA